MDLGFAKEADHDKSGALTFSGGLGRHGMRAFNSRLAHRQATTLGKLLTPMCLCQQAVQFGTGQRAVMLCGREGKGKGPV